MLKNYFKIAWRNLIKNRTYSAINIIGLAIGLTSFIIILLYLNYELSYDKWDDSLKNVYKVSMRTDEDVLPQTQAPLAAYLKENSPLIKDAVKMQGSGNFEVLLAVGEKKIYQTGGIEADSNFFKVFPYKLTHGDDANVLNKPNAIVISTNVAKKLFNNENAIGKTIKIFNAFDCEVTGIMQDQTKPASLDAQFVYRSPYEKGNQFWQNYSYETYVKTNGSVPISKLEKNLDSLYYNSQLKKDGQTYQAFHQAGHQAGLFVDALQQLHNYPKYGSSNINTVYILLLLATLLLIAGAINFSNLSIAASLNRAKEVGVRKVLGSGRKALIGQFMFEIGLQCIASLLLAILLVNLILPYFNNEFNIKIAFLQSNNLIKIIIELLVCLLVVIWLSGFYPAYFLSKYNINEVLKGKFTQGKKSNLFRNVLTVVQFSVSAFFVILIIVISSQMHFMQNKDKGFSPNQVLRIETIQKTREANFATTKNILLSIPGVKDVSKSTTVPGDELNDTSTVTFKIRDQKIRMSSVKISEDYFATLNTSILKGRDFGNSFADQNTKTAIINEAAAKKMNLPNPIGSFISFPNCDSVPLEIIGVVNNFNVSGFENRVQPVVYTIGNKACMFQSGGAILVKLNGVDIQQSLAEIEKAWKQIEPEFPLRYSFLDANFEKLFTSYIRLQKIISFFGATAILIAFMGLFALTAFLVKQRTKEIGIRKILGAGIADLGLLLGKDFLWLVLIAILIAAPIGWWASNKWLQEFAYRINIGWWMIPMAAMALIVVAVATVSFQTIKAARANPVESLRSE